MPSSRNRRAVSMLAVAVALALQGPGLAWAAKQTVDVTPHDSYSSSVGVLGCKINTNRVAYWPMAVDCSNICVSLSYGGRSVYLLRVDQSGGAHDVSYDAWNYLVTGQSATAHPTAGGGIAMQTENVDMAHCAGLLTDDADGRLPLSASNSMNFLSSCLQTQDAGNASWVAAHYKLFNIQDPICTYGYDEACSLANWPSQNQATCHHPLGSAHALTSAPVYNIQYPTGKRVVAGAAPEAASSSAARAVVPVFGRPIFSLLVFGASCVPLMRGLLGGL